MEFSSAGSFIATKEHRRFVEFANAVRKHRSIGLCYCRAGVGKTLSARRYAKWNESLLKITYIGICIELGLEIKESGTLKKHRPPLGESQRNLQLLIIDESERLSTAILEYLRDVFDRLETGLILIGMPGFEKRMSRYPQLYSRVGFAHQYRPLQNEELTFVLTRRWSKLGFGIDDTDFTDAQAVAAIVRITGGNFRLLQRLLIQIERILRINELSTISAEVVKAARSTLVIGAT